MSAEHKKTPVEMTRCCEMSTGDCYARGEKLFNDCVHGHFVLPKLCVEIIDTRTFQRLRNIKQLGHAYWVYPGAAHNRFEHSLGVCHLAGEMVDTLNRSHLHPNILITDSEKLCLQVAGLCHDLGHGPFSHSWEKVIHSNHGKNSWNHEQMSVLLFDTIMENEKVKKVFMSCGLGEEHKQFIKNLMRGKKDKDSERSFLFEIICNNDTGIDVDKWDYLLRDGKQLNIKVTFDPHRLLKCLRIVKAEGKYHICYRNKERKNIFHMYMMRAELHYAAYQHPVVKMIEEMWLDAVLEADRKNYLFKGLKLSEIHKDPRIYSFLTDQIFQDIISSEDQNFENARNLLERILNRNLYKTIRKITLDNPAGEKQLERIIKSIEKKRTKMSEDKIPLDLYVTYLKLEMPDLSKTVFLYDKNDIDDAKIENDWTSVPVYPYNMCEMKRTEVFFYCKNPESLMEDKKKEINSIIENIITECVGQ